MGARFKIPKTPDSPEIVEFAKHLFFFDVAAHMSA